MAKYFQGDVVLVNFPFTDLSNSKRRPAIVVSNSKINASKDVILAPITSQPGGALSYEFSNNDLDKPIDIGSCDVKCHVLFTVAKDMIIKKISKMKHDKLSGVLDTIIKGLKIE